jgi:hypothetical protein
LPANCLGQLTQGAANLRGVTAGVHARRALYIYAWEPRVRGLAYPAKGRVLS